MSSINNYYQELLGEAIKSTKDLCSALVQAYATSNTKQIDSFLPLLHESVTKLETLYPKASRPRWISIFKQILQPLVSDQSISEQIRGAFFGQFIIYRNDIENLSVEVILSAPMIDFDSVVEHAAKEFKIDELYKKAIEDLRNLIESGEIDSAKVQSDLQELLGTLFAAKNASYFSKISSAQFVRTYFKHLGKEYLNNTKLGKAFLSTLEELGISTDEIIKKLQREVEDVAKNKALDLKENLLQLTKPDVPPED